MSKIVIDEPALLRIRDLAIGEFHEAFTLPESSQDTQLFLLLRGFERWLHLKGIEPNFTVLPISEPNKFEKTSIDDMG